MKLLMEPMVVAAILMKELPDKQVGSAESAKDASAAPEVPARIALCALHDMVFTPFLLLFPFPFLPWGAESATSRAPETARISADSGCFLLGDFCGRWRGGVRFMRLDFACRRGFRSCGSDQRAFRSPFGNLRAPMLLDFHCCFWARLRTRFICIPHSAFRIANFPLLPPVPLHRKKQTWYDNQTNRQGRMDGWTRHAGSSC